MFLQKEHLYKGKEKEFEFKLLMRPRQENAAWMNKIVQQLSQFGNLVVDTCAGTFFVAKACMVLPKRGIILGCELDITCMTEAMLKLSLLHD